MKIKKLIRNATFSLVALIGSSMTFASDAEFNFKFHHFLPPMSLHHQEIFIPWADKINKESNGRIKIDIFPAMQLGGSPQQLFDQARKGVVDIAWTIGGYTPGRFPKSTVFELPFMTSQSARTTSMAMQKFAEDEMNDELKDVKLLAAHGHAPGTLHSSKDVIRSSEDLKGLKLRAPNKTMAAAFELLGAQPVFLPVTQMPSALSKGVFDVAAIPFDVVKPLRLHEMARNHTEIKGNRGLYTTFFMIVMNKDSYNKLPSDLKAVIDRNSGITFSENIGNVYEKSEAIGHESASSLGNNFYTLSNNEVESWKTKMGPIVDDWIQDMNSKGYDGDSLFKKANDLIDEFE